MEKFDFAIQVLVIGFSVVMVALIGLYLLLLLFAKIFHKEEKRKPAETTSAIVDQAAASKPDDDRRLTSAITAAVYAYMQLNNIMPPSGRISIAVQQSGPSVANNWQVTGRRVLLQNSMDLEIIRRKKQRENI